MHAFLILAAALLTLPLSAAVAGAPSSGGQASEYQLKAVFLFNFAQFVEWPPKALPQSEEPLVIGVLGADPFGPELDAVVRGEQVNGRSLVVQRYASIGELNQCHILFVSRAEARQLEKLLAALNGRSVLTVSDAEDSAQRGVMIQFVNDRNRIRLRINVEAAKAAGLTISSKLLRPAEIVGARQG